MKVTYDSEADAADIVFGVSSFGIVADTYGFFDGPGAEAQFSISFDAQGKIFSVEVIWASKGLRKELLALAHDLSKHLGCEPEEVDTSSLLDALNALEDCSFVNLSFSPSQDLAYLNLGLYESEIAIWAEPIRSPKGNGQVMLGFDKQACLAGIKFSSASKLLDQDLLDSAR